MPTRKTERNGNAPPESQPPEGTQEPLAPARSGEGVDSVIPALREQEQRRKQQPQDSQ
jgi:hypothetical protein